MCRVKPTSRLIALSLAGITSLYLGSERLECDDTRTMICGPVASDAVIRVYDAAGNVIETHQHKGDFKEP
jgi:hypothetical protein